MSLLNGHFDKYIFELPPLIGFQKKIEGNTIQHNIDKSNLIEVNVEQYESEKGIGYILKPLDGRYVSLQAKMYQ